jgi:hypothetical protein
MRTQKQSQQKPKKSYAAPRLVRYGNVRALTQAGTGGSAEGAMMTNVMRKASSRTVKENVVRIGDHPLGIGLYLFDFIPAYREQYGYERQFGIMADEVEAVMPEAVSMHPDGYEMVDYAMLGITRAG